MLVLRRSQRPRCLQEKTKRAPKKTHPVPQPQQEGTGLFQFNEKETSSTSTKQTGPSNFTKKKESSVYPSIGKKRPSFSQLRERHPDYLLYLCRNGEPMLQKKGWSSPFALNSPLTSTPTEHSGANPHCGHALIILPHTLHTYVYPLFGNNIHFLVGKSKRF